MPTLVEHLQDNANRFSGKVAVITSYSIHYTKLYDLLARLDPGLGEDGAEGRADREELTERFRLLQVCNVGRVTGGTA